MKRYFETRGCENLVIAPVITDTEDAYETGEVMDLIGLASISREVSSTTETGYYDNAARTTIYSEGDDVTTISGSAIDDKTLAAITGKTFDESIGGFLDNNVGNVPMFALGYKTSTTDGRDMYVWKYKGSFQIPSESVVTRDSGTERSGTELTFTSIYTTHKFANGAGQGKSGSLRMMRLDDKLADTAGVDLSKFFEQVTTPDNIQKKTV